MSCAPGFIGRSDRASISCARAVGGLQQSPCQLAFVLVRPSDDKAELLIELN